MQVKYSTILCKTRADYDKLLSLLKDYLEELHRIDERVAIRTTEELAYEYLYTGDTDFYLLCKENLEKLNTEQIAIGFAIVGIEDNCHPDADMYIEEFYIVPEHRRQYAGRFFLESIIYRSKVPKTVCFFILKNNLAAKGFWKKMFSKWKDVSNKYEKPEDMGSNLDFFIYENERDI